MPLSIDLIASQRNYYVHLEPIWAALPEKGALVTHETLRSSEAVLVAGYQDVVLAQRWGYSRIALLEHGIGQSYLQYPHPAYPGGTGRDMIGLFLSPNETAAGMDRAAYPAARVAVVGDPHLDGLPRRVPDGLTTVCLSFHWSGSFVPELKSALDHYKAVLPDLGKAFHVIGHSHPKTDLSDLYLALGWEYVRDFDEVCRRADVYVADNTSTLYEFASTGRPVVVLNIPTYRRDVNHGLRFWQAQLVGLVVDRPSYLVDAVRYALRDGSPRSAERALDIVYQPRHGGTALAVAAITEWLADAAVAA